MNKKINISITTVTIFLIIVLSYIFFSNKSTNKTNNINSNLVPSNFLNYSNKDIGIQFTYLKSLGNLQEKTLTRQNNQEITTGNGYQIDFGDNPDAFSIILASKDFGMFKVKAYRSVGDKSIFCPKFDIYNSVKQNFCKTITINNSFGFEEYYIEVDEGVVFVNRSIYSDFNKAGYTGVTFLQTFPELNEEMQKYISSKENFDINSSDIISNLVNKKDLTEKTIEHLKTMDDVMESLKF